MSMNRRGLVLGLLTSLAALPAAATDARQRRATPSSSGKPSVAERANRRAGRAAETRTADKVKDKATSADAAMNRLVGRRGR
jgi:hypothetical protein